MLSIGRTTMYELVGAGEIDVVHIGRSARVPVEALQEFVDRQRRGAATVRSRTMRPGPSWNLTRASRPPEQTGRPTIMTALQADSHAAAFASVEEVLPWPA